MLTIRQTWEALVREAAALPGFKQVAAYPFNRVNDAEFLKDFPGLKLPACLIVFLGRRTDMKGGADDRTYRWSAICVSRDVGGDAFAVTADLIDQVQEQLLDRQIENDELTILGSNDVAVAFTDPKFSVMELAFTTREAAER
jgi:hypothetical protein